MAHRWGASEAELASSLPGDELRDRPVVRWTNAITIDAPPEKVWPWIIQIGDTRGGFYSYTFIENAIAGKPLYHNAARIVPEYQNPNPGEEIIGGMLKLREYKTGEYMLAESASQDVGWTWVWSIFPAGNGQAPGDPQPCTALKRRRREPVMTFFLDAGGFGDGAEDECRGSSCRWVAPNRPMQRADMPSWLVAGLRVGAGLAFC
jgi:hypothetical protein